MSDLDAQRALSDFLAADPSRYGFKVALNFPGPQRVLGLSGPVVAPLADSPLYASGAALPRAAERALHVEAELALALARPVHAPLAREALRASVATVTPCLELVDYALARGPLDVMMRHRFFHAGIVLGTAHDAGALGLLERDLPRIESSDGSGRKRLAGTVPDDVLDALARLVAQVLAAGGRLEAGQVVLCGSYVEPLPLLPGATVRADFGPLGTVTITREA